MRVVFIDDDAELRRANSQTLKLHGFQVEAHASARAALPVLTRAFDGVVVTDIRMPDMDGLQLFQRLRDLDAEIPVILITGHGDIATAVQCMREGAYDFLAKPYPAERLIATIGHAAEKRRLVLENRRLRKRLRLGRRRGAVHRQYPGHAADQADAAAYRRRRRGRAGGRRDRHRQGSGRQRTASYEPPTPARTGGDQLRARCPKA